jgi:hypothetical protein
MKIADEQLQRPVTRMYAKEGEDHLRQDAAIRRINTQLLDPAASPPFICDLCSVAFLTKRELQLHVMCHGIHIAGNVSGEKVQAVVQQSGEVSAMGAVQSSEGNQGCLRFYLLLLQLFRHELIEIKFKNIHIDEGIRLEV